MDPDSHPDFAVPYIVLYSSPTPTAPTKGSFMKSCCFLIPAFVFLFVNVQNID